MPIIRHTIWVSVSDGAGYRVFSCKKPGGPLKQLTKWTSDDARKTTKELGTERPGRSQAAPGQARHAFANKADWHDQAEKETTRKLAHFLNRKYLAKKFDRLILIAPPKTLGEVRPVLKFREKKDVVREFAKDLVNLSIHELQAYLEKNL
jgi:protein required for attachment to host cells